MKMFTGFVTLTAVPAPNVTVLGHLDVFDDTADRNPDL